MNVVFLGPPSAGKGTQAVQVAADLDMLHLSTGDVLRREVAEGTKLGLEARAYMDEGKLVPDQIVVGMVARALEGANGRSGVLFDGFPRTCAQAEALADRLEARGDCIDRVVYFDLDREELVKRSAGRRTCSNPTCGRIYHVDYRPPQFAGVCDDCGSALYQRDDDAEEVVRGRLEEYARKTEPLLDYFRAQGTLETVDAGGSVDRVRASIDEVLDEAEGRGA